MKLLVFGSLNIDHVYRLPHLVREGETLASARYEKNAGGKGFNQAVALARAGQKAWFAGAVGQDGEFLRGELASLGVDVENLRTIEEPTGHAIIQVDEQGRNAIVLYGGANRRVTPAMIEQTLAGFGAGDCVLLQNEISGVPEIIRRAAERGMRVILNPSPVSPELLAAPLEQVDWFILNEVEGLDMTGEREPDAILRALLARYPQSRVVLTLGEQGAIYADADARVRQSAVPVRAVDTTAAGDTFTGFFLRAILAGDAPERALQIAAQAAAIAVSRPGAGPSIPVMSEVRAAMGENVGATASGELA